MADAVCLGELLIDFVPTVTPTTLAHALGKAPGWAPAEVAAGLELMALGPAGCAYPTAGFDDAVPGFQVLDRQPATPMGRCSATWPRRDTREPWGIRP